MRKIFLFLSIFSAFAWAQQGRCYSNRDCPPSDPVCSEYGYCQCASYRPGDAACWGRGGGGSRGSTGVVPFSGQSTFDIGGGFNRNPYAGGYNINYSPGYSGPSYN